MTNPSGSVFFLVYIHGELQEIEYNYFFEIFFVHPFWYIFICEFWSRNWFWYTFNLMHNKIKFALVIVNEMWNSKFGNSKFVMDNIILLGREFDIKANF